MAKNITRPILMLAAATTAVVGAVAWSGQGTRLEASSHREAPLIADDPLADNTDLYAFRSPDAPDNITIIANYIPLELPQGGPNYNTFGENVRYEIHVKNSATTTGDDITYRFTFARTNQDPTTFFNIRLGQQNLKTTYTLEAIRGGTTTTLVTNGVVPPPNIGPRSITSAAGLNTTYNALMTGAIQSLANGVKVFCGPTDDPFFVDLGGIFDLGGVRVNSARDGVARKNTHAIALQIPIALLQKDGKTAAQATTILDPDFVIGVWASASRPAIRTLNVDGTQAHTGNWIQVSRLGMPLTNEVIVPIGGKDRWNSRTPYTEDVTTDDYLSNPELGLYMAEGTANGTTYYGTAVPGLSALRIQSNSLQAFDFRNGANGVSGLTPAQRAGTVFADPTFGPYLLRAGKPRSVDILPIFHTGVPNLPPYQLATGKPARNPLAAGKPFINNFLPVLGDMLRLNMAVPPTPRNSADFSSEGLLAAAVLGLTDPRFNANATLQNIPNMDGFPNGRRLEDDVTRIELQAVGGAVLAAIGLFYDDYTATTTSPVTPQLLGVVGFRTGVEANDTTFKAAFPYAQTPWSGTNAQRVALSQRTPTGGLGLQPNVVESLVAFPNPVVDQTTFRYEVGMKSDLTLRITDLNGRVIATPMKGKAHKPGAFEYEWRMPAGTAAGIYVATLSNGSTVLQTIRIVHQR
ncbi:DUF4331 family protein [Microvirga sp. STR05]|uniref:DUF4331 family protein n=1 Tax=Hymenobacter duratus TaxID=2771356 RepID=A0ABR8JEI2_9BACT|nr:DUF4331 family protein [Hymenobacter duratus]MBD2714462.1 DUF4331 family protein [Hymenobacter duratus]MBR7949366.1 DUF4331 family protein [Microvirga sp. STR05]